MLGVCAALAHIYIYTMDQEIFPGLVEISFTIN